MKKYNQTGWAHVLIPLVVIGLMAVLGTLFYMRSNAAVAAPRYRIATYNILGSNHVAAGQRVGGSVAARATRETNIIKGVGPDGAFDVVGVQEMKSDQFRLFNSKLPGYAHFPVHHSAQRTIYWKSAKFKRVASGTVHYPFYGDNGLHSGGLAYWVKLQDRNTGTLFYVMNVHPVAWNIDPGSDKGGAQKREKTAHIMRNWVAKKKKTGHAVFVTGDMNSAFYLRIYDKNFHERVKDNAIVGQRAKLPYCIMTNLNVMRNTYDMVRGVTGHCPTHGVGVIDHVYASTGGHVKITKWKRINTTAAKHASDHRPVYVIAKVSNSKLALGPSSNFVAQLIGSSSDDDAVEPVDPASLDDTADTSEDSDTPDAAVEVDTDVALPEDEMIDSEDPSTAVDDSFTPDAPDPAVTEDPL